MGASMNRVERFYCASLQEGGATPVTPDAAPKGPHGTIPRDTDASSLSSWSDDSTAATVTKRKAAGVRRILSLHPNGAFRFCVEIIAGDEVHEETDFICWTGQFQAARRYEKMLHASEDTYDYTFEASQIVVRSSHMNFSSNDKTPTRWTVYLTDESAMSSMHAARSPVYESPFASAQSAATTMTHSHSWAPWSGGHDHSHSSPAPHYPQKKDCRVHTLSQNASEVVGGLEPASLAKGPANMGDGLQTQIFYSAGVHRGVFHFTGVRGPLTNGNIEFSCVEPTSRILVHQKRSPRLKHNSIELTLVARQLSLETMTDDDLRSSDLIPVPKQKGMCECSRVCAGETGDS